MLKTKTTGREMKDAFNGSIDRVDIKRKVHELEYRSIDTTQTEIQKNKEYAGGGGGREEQSIQEQ